MKISRPGRLTLSTLSLLMATTPVLSQNGPGLVGTLSFDQTLSFDSNPDLVVTPGDGKIVSTTDLNFSLSSETRSERFRFNVGGVFDGAFGSGATSADDLTFKNESASLTYGREGANSSLSLRARYSNFDIEDEVFGFFVDGIFDPDALIIDGGERERTLLTGRLEFGKEGPLGVEVRARNNVVDYTGVTDPELVDSESNSLNAVATIRTNRAWNINLSAGIERTDEEDINDTSWRSNYLGVGIEGEFNNGLSYSADLYRDEADNYQLGSLTNQEEGLGFAVGLTQLVPDGSYGVSVGSRVDSSGRRNTANVNRLFELPNGGLSLSLGLVEQDGSDTDITATVVYSREGRDSRIEAELVQEPSTNDGDALLNTSVNITYERDINAYSSWDANFSYGASSSIGASNGDTRTSASLGYTRNLTEDWDLRAGVSIDRIEQSGSGDITSNSVFVSVGRDFSFGF
ncbi:MAG: hypothetical protein OXQ30_13740 [Boseongicola sp.]|nr:hypothetical protein [Boseongicola sp.]